jgi:hypothetical protein
LMWVKQRALDETSANRIEHFLKSPDIDFFAVAWTEMAQKRIVVERRFEMKDHAM